MEPKFIISEVFSTAWKGTKSQLWILAGLLIGYCILSFTLTAFAMPMQSSIIGKIIVNVISESLHKSWEITKGQVLPLFILALVMIGILILGCILFGIGIFVAVPLIYMMYGYVFRKLNTPLQILE